MSIAGSINSLSDVDVSYIGSAEDAIALATAVQLGVSDELRKYLKGEIEAKNNLPDIINNFSGIKSQLSSLLSQPISKVTPSSLKNAGSSSEALSQLFNADGIRLGTNFSDSSEALQNLQDQGIVLSTTVEYPIFEEKFDTKGTLVSENISWFTPELKDLLDNMLPGSPSNKFNNATVYYVGEPGKGTQITVFNDQKNIRVDEQSITNSLHQAQNKYDVYLDVLNNSIAKINAATNKLNDAIDGISKVTASQQKLLSDLRSVRESFANQTFESRRIDRINFLNKLEQKYQSEKEVNSINSTNSDSILEKNKSYKVENPSPISNWLLMENANQNIDKKSFQTAVNLSADKNKNNATSLPDIGRII